jgi:hypothetical protein
MTVPSSTLSAANRGAGAARLHRQARLSAVERLDLTLFIDREHHRVLGRIDIEANNILELLGELRRSTV